MSTVKKQLFDEVNNRLKERLNVIQSKISDIQNALQSETKSTAGDKHETGRAMLQLEREKTGQQLAELQKQIEILSRIDTNHKHERVALGSIIKTTKANYFISVSLGEIVINKEAFYAISSATPIAKLILSREVGDSFSFRNTTFVIQDVY